MARNRLVSGLFYAKATFADIQTTLPGGDDMNFVQIGRCYLGVAVFCSGLAFAQHSQDRTDSAPAPQQAALLTASPADASGPQASTAASTPPTHTAPPNHAAPVKHKLGPLDVVVNWRTRAEGWYWFQGNTGNSTYGLWGSLLRVGIGQSGDRFDWFLEGEQPSILGLPNHAVVAAPQGATGLGGTYFAANNNHVNVANGFVKQAFVNFKHLGPAGVKIGRFEYFDGLEVKPADPLLAAVIQTRISSRLISNFAFTAVQRSFDGVQLTADSEKTISLSWARDPPRACSR